MKPYLHETKKNMKKPTNNTCTRNEAITWKEESR